MRLVLVEWLDAHGCSSDWEHLDISLLRPRVTVCKSVGWLAHDGEDCKVLIPHVADLGGENGEPGQGCGDMTIPSRAVVSMADLAVSEQPRDAKETVSK